jgi:hypothetical protein
MSFDQIACAVIEQELHELRAEEDARRAETGILGPAQETGFPAVESVHGRIL